MNGVDKPILVGLVGQPNVGKSTVFNLITGLSQHIGNWPGKTIERREDAVTCDGATLRIVDLPGTYRLSSDSPEERVSRDFILRERPDVIVMVANAAALERNLYLLAELLWLPAPVILVLNMLDLARSEGVEIQPQVLAAALRLPVVPLVATHAASALPLLREVLRLAREPARFSPRRPDLGALHHAAVANIRRRLAGYVPAPYDPSWVAMKLLEGDGELVELARGWLPESEGQDLDTLLRSNDDAGPDTARSRYDWIGHVVATAVRRAGTTRISLTDRLDRWAIHPLWGVLLLLAGSALVFAVTFELGVPAQEWLDGAAVEPLRSRVAVALSSAPPWVAGLVADGVLGGAGIVVTFVPVLVVFFTALGIMESTGLLARAAYVMHRFMRMVGLHGKSFLPLSMGFGCNVPAVMGARIIEEPVGRLLTILLAPLVPCSARFAVLAFLTPIFFGPAALPVAVGLVALNLTVLAMTGVTLSRMVFRGRRTPFIMELPLYHVPGARATARFVAEKTLTFLRNAGTIIVLLSVLVWAAAYFPHGDLDQSWLARFGHALAPLGRVLGLDWRMLVALLAGFVAKENAVATLGILYTAGPSDAALTETLAAQVPPAAALSFLTATMLFIPCAATVAAMRQETHSWRWTLFGVTLVLGIAIGAAAAVYQLAQLLEGL
ncbi:MAG: ferrous iron transport protein B [Gemmatimonadota bacterium]